MDEIEVTARFDPEGNFMPLAFVWRERTYKVDAIGRNWKAEDGHHILVMDPRHQTYHLLLQTETARWYLFHGGNYNAISKV